ncbi:MAG TPA: GAF domain-containing protein [Chloroflexi bacterium]|nr:GAF domain-containing protein [Chloroflexota bacterium]
MRERNTDEHQTHIAQLEILRRIGLELTAELDLEVLLHSIVSQAVDLLRGTAGALNLYRADRDVLECAAVVDPLRTSKDIVIHRGEGLIGQVWETDRPLIVSDYQAWEERSAAWESYPVGSIVGVPVRWGTEFLGVLDVLSDRPDVFSEDDAELLSLLATQAAIAIRNARLYDEAESRAQRLTVVNRIARAVGATLDLDELAETVYQEIASTLPTDAFFFALYDAANDRLNFCLHVDGQVRGAPLRVPLGEGLTSFIITQKKPLLIRDEGEWEHLPPGVTPIVKGRPAVSWLGAPLLVGERVLGAICVQAYHPYAYGEEEHLLFGTIADQVAVAVETAQLYEQARRRAVEQESFSRIVYALNTLNLEEAFPVLAEELQRLSGCQRVSIVLRDETGKNFVMSILQPSSSTLSEGVVMPVTASAAFEDITASRPHLTPDLSTELDFPAEQLLYQGGIRSRINLPLLAGGEVLGSLNLGSLQPGPFWEDQLPVLQQVADALSSAIENNRLFQAEREQRELAQALERAAAAVSSTLDRNQVLDRILEQAARVVAGDAFNIMLVKDGLAQVVRARGYEQFGVAERVLRFAAPISDFPGMIQMVQTGEPRPFPDTAADPDWVSPAGWEWQRAYVGAPILVGGATVGFLNVDGTRPHQFNATDIRRLEAFAAHAAAAIENAQLYEQAHNRLVSLANLNLVSQALTSSLNLEQVLSQIVNLTSSVVRSEYTSVILLDEQGALAEQAENLGDVSPIARRIRSQGITRRVLSDGRPVIADVVSDTGAIDPPLCQPDGKPLLANPDIVTAGIRSFAAVPIQFQDETIGVLFVHSREPGVFQGQLSVLTIFANQAAVAIENARLHQQVRDHATELEEHVQRRTAQVRSQYARLEAILTSTTDGIVVTDRHGILLQANPVAQMWLTQTFSPPDANRLWKVIQDLAQRAEERPGLVLELPGLDLALEATSISDPGTDDASAVVMLRDISKFKALERMKTYFVANASDELRMPITTIKSYAYLLCRTPPEDERWHRYLEALIEAADYQVQMVEDILQISRIYTGRWKPSYRRTDLVELVHTSVIQHEARAREQGLTLEYHVAEPELMVPLDPQQMSRVLNNLLSDAIHYTPAGGRVTVVIELRQFDGKEWVTVAVLDTGNSIPAEDIPYIFERFFREEQPRSQRVNETGLRLMIAKSIVDLHHGRMTVNSEQEHRNIFTIWLPLSNGREELR